jgi:hypothetical protein
MNIRDILNYDDAVAVRVGDSSYGFSGALASTPHSSFMAPSSTKERASRGSRSSGSSGGKSLKQMKEEEEERRELIPRELNKMADFLFQRGKVYLSEKITSIGVGKLLHPRVVEMWISLVVNPASPLSPDHKEDFDRDFLVLLPGFMDDDLYTAKVAKGGVFFPRDRVILAPIQHPTTKHWVLLVFTVEEMSVIIYDVMNHADKAEAIYRPFKDWLKKVHVIEQGAEWHGSGELEYSQYFNVSKNMSPVDLAEADLKNNSGIFMCMFMWYIIHRGLDKFEFEPDDSMRARLWIIHKLSRAMIRLFHY